MDGASEMDASADDGGVDRDAFVTMRDGGSDGGPSIERATCESCEGHDDCATGSFCVSLTAGGRACVPSCNPDIPTCPRSFSCVLDVASGVDSTVCLPIGGTCCVDEDGDEYGVGVGCSGNDCNDDDETINPGADETCNGLDDDCDGIADDPPTDCVSGRCSITSDGTYEAIEGADCAGGMCASGTMTDCALFTCEDGGELGNRCATTCAPGGSDNDAYCIEGAHCEAGVCTADVPNGGTCDEDTDCTSAHCENGFCCGSGACCSVPSDCPGSGGVGAVCDDAMTCQGSRGALLCVENVCLTDSGIPDDTACATTTQARDCGLYDPVFCTGAADQSAPACPTSCTNDSQCIEAAHCEAGVCVGDRPQGGICARVEDCQSGLSCSDGRCCDRACSGTCEACDLPSREGTCTLVPAMADPDAECPGLSCAAHFVTFDALGRCFRHADVPAAIAACDGAGSCLDAADLCPSQPAGPIHVDCDDVCEAPTAGTCTGMIPGTCTDLDDPADTRTCGIGACASTVQRCTGGIATMCTPGTATAEVCNGADDNCNGVADEGVAAVMCPPGANVSTTECAGGACGIVSCAPLFADCDGVVATGCERPLTTLTSCGACGRMCTLPHANETCAGGTCEIASCESGWADCDGDAANGCETNTRTLTDCGGCGAACSLSNATASCGTGTCEIVSCTTGFGDCDGLDVTGCERSLRTLTDCGTCGTACNIPGAGESCATGACEPSACDPLRADCDGNAANGCETPTNTATSCGGCDIPCALAHASETCTSGSCVLLACDTGWADCDGNPVNGCETDIRTLSNCGACGTSCDLANASESCASGSCALTTCNGGFGNCDGMVANGCETPLTTLTDCGGCGTRCDLSRAGESCASGSCVLTTCDTGWGNCDGTTGNGCETPLNTLSDCGACGMACSLANAGESCASGTCTITTCDPLFASCDMVSSNGCERPVNTLTDCGACNAPCDLANASESCASGACVLGMCDPGFGNCDGASGNGCERPLNTLTNCGGCGIACNLANASESCATGSCLLDTCEPGFANCDGNNANGCERPINTLTDCGGCGVVCDRANAGESCVTGTCTLGACEMHFANCDGNATNGCERAINTTSDCGGCGIACDLPNAAESCTSGTCTLGACSAGFANCDGDTSNGCERSTTTVTDCGGCGVACSRPHATTSCGSGTCQIASCDAGWEDCDGNPANGCERSIQTLTDCGSCGIPCTRANASATCSTGSCGIASCNAGFENCDGSDANGCERNIRTVTDCGGCGTACTLAHATETCSTGTCAIASCDAGWADCDGNPANGCERSITTLTDCGGCGVGCNLANAAESCASGMCVITSCTGLFADCDGVPGNGCERAINTLSDCGSCGTPCDLANAAESCASGTCTLGACNTNFANCDGMSSNGCERPTNTLTDCGGCGVPCSLANATESCSSGTCTLGTCSAGFGNCNGTTSDGCERNLNTDVNYCGSCSNNCATQSHPNASGEACVAGTCRVTSCTGGFYDQNGTFNDGCECAADTWTDSCATATNLGSLGVGGTPLTRTGNLVPTGDTDWFQVTFNTSGATCAWRPRVTIGGTGVVFRVYTSCSSGTPGGGQSCAEGGTSGSRDLTSWDYNNSTTCNADRGAIDPSPDTGNYITHPTTVWIRVSATASSTSCLPYTLTISN